MNLRRLDNNTIQNTSRKCFKTQIALNNIYKYIFLRTLLDLKSEIRDLSKFTDVIRTQMVTSNTYTCNIQVNIFFFQV
jgi:hypothetical protein